jgi:hypothetical protein
MGEECQHEDAYIEKACCSPFQRIVECGCGGRDEVICPNEHCTGIKDSEVDELFERLT